MLSSTAARRNFGDHGERFNGLFHAIDQLGALYDGLEAVRVNQDPLRTPESNAIAYRQNFDAATAKARAVIEANLNSLVDLQGRVIQGAHQEAGLDVIPAEAAEIRQALRALPQDKRDAEIGRAIERGDAAVIASVMHARCTSDQSARSTERFRFRLRDAPSCRPRRPVAPRPIAPPPIPPRPVTAAAVTQGGTPAGSAGGHSTTRTISSTTISFVPAPVQFD
jgi:hypothetical protein